MDKYNAENRIVYSPDAISDNASEVSDASKESRITMLIQVYGIVQGVGFRPTVARHAKTSGICGSVINKGSYVEIMAQGTARQCRHFQELLEKQPPKRAYILKISAQELGHESEIPLYDSFIIAESEHTDGDIYISPDIAICDDCKRELFDKNNRRYLHPFINCTNCGPRMTILDALPYDRERTSMKDFPMCPECSREYHSHGNRRFDAQPVCCNSCGPEVYILDKGSGKPDAALRRNAAITHTRRIISSGGIAAVKGIGGFHLCCDASNENAVSLLRSRKHRLSKPFAVMMRDMETAQRECSISHEEAAVLSGHRKPIVLLPRLHDGHQLIAPSVAPGNPKLGVMLPYAPVQLLLFDYDDDVKMPDCLVMTSANESGAPICRDDNDAVNELSELADVILSNNRLIRVRADDTVTDFFDGKPYMIRRSRGYAPLPLMFTSCVSHKKEHISTDPDCAADNASAVSKPSVLGIGGELKNSFCIGSGELFYPSPYIGDLSDIRTIDALRETINRFMTLLEVRPQAVACDMHPLYQSRNLAYELCSEWGNKSHGHFGDIRSDKAIDNFCPELPYEYSWEHFRKDLRSGASEAVREVGDRDGGKALCKECGENAVQSGRQGLCEGALSYTSSGTVGYQGDQEAFGYQKYQNYEGYQTYPGAEGAEKGAFGASYTEGYCGDEPAEYKASGSGKDRIRLFELQHHYAHILSCMAENDIDRPVIGISFDGTGYGTDRTIWGGEILISDWNGFLRAGHISPFMQVGGDISSREGWRIAASMLSDICREKDEAIQLAVSLGLCSAKEYKLISAMAERGINSVRSTSAGRLFDAVSAVLGIRRVSSFEGDASTALMYKAMEYKDSLCHGNADTGMMSGKANGDAFPYRLTYKDDESIVLNTRELFRYMADEAAAGEDKGRLAFIFHSILADMIAAAALSSSELTGIKTAALSGGVFQNTLLLGLVRGRLLASGMEVLLHSLIPPNDGGIGLGQAVYAMKHIQTAM